MRVYCRTLDGSSFSVEAKSADSVQQLKRAISKASKQSGVAAKMQLVFRGNFLHDSQSLKHCGLENDCLLAVISVEADSKILDTEAVNADIESAMNDLLSDAEVQEQEAASEEGNEDEDFADRMRRWPQLSLLRRIVSQDATLLPSLLHRIGTSCPQLLRDMQANQAALLRLLLASSDSASATGAAAYDAGASERQLTPDQQAAVQRLIDLGFNERKAAKAYIDCDFDEESAIQQLLQQERQ